MRVLVRVDAVSIERIERFLREEADPRTTLGAPWLAVGLLGSLVCAVARASAVTIGPIVFLEKRAATRLHDDRLALVALGDLFVHEAVHLWQWRRDGWIRFPALYLYFYFSRLSVMRVFRSDERNRAYRAIPAEAEAFDLERRWRRREVALA